MMKFKTTMGVILKLLLLAVSALCFPEQAWSLHHKEPATLKNTAIICLILLPPLMLLGFFRIQKWQVGRKNREKLGDLAASDPLFDNEKISSAINETLEVVIRTALIDDHNMSKTRLTPKFRNRYELEPDLFNDYESLAFDMILSVDSTSRSVEAVVTCGRKSRKNTRTPTVEEAWKFVESNGQWLLDSVRDVDVSEYVETQFSP